MAKGIIRQLLTNRGFGFIKTAEGKDLFFHRNQLEGVDFFSLREGQQVEFEVGRGRNGRPQAVKVRPTQINGKSASKAAITRRHRYYPGLIAGIIVILFFGIALCLRVVLPHGEVFVGDWIKLTGTDAYYFMRQVDNLVHNFPHSMSFDPYLLYPGGQALGSLSFFVYLLSGIAWLIGLGSPTQHMVDMVGVYFPAVVGAFAVIPAYFIGKELFNRWAGVITAGLLAIAPGEFMGRSILGRADRDALEILLTLLTMLFFILAIKSAKQKELGFNLRPSGQTIIKPLVYSLLTGIFLGLYLLTWRGSLLFVFIIFAYLVIQAIIDHLKHNSINYLGFIGTITFLVALIIFLPSHPYKIYSASLVIATLTPAVLTAISWLMLKTRTKVGYYPLALFGLSLAGLAVLYVVDPSISESMLSQVRIFTPSETHATILESQPILFPGGIFSLSVIWDNFTTGFFLSLISLGILIYLVIKRGEAAKTLILVWSLVILVATLSLGRLALLYAINVAILSGYLAWLILSYAGLKEKPAPTAVEAQEAMARMERIKKKKKHVAPLTSSWPRTKISLALIGIFFVFFFPNFAPAYNTAKEGAFAFSDGWCESISWMKDNTSDPFGDPDFYYASYTTPFRYPKTAYGVTAWWDYGYLITRTGHRLPNCNAGGGEPRRKQVAYLFTAQDEASAASIISKLKSRYVIIDYSTAVLSPTYYVLGKRYGLSGKFSAIATYADSSAESFYDLYYQLKDGSLKPVPIFYPEYYRSLAVRLYNFNGGEVIPKASTVISYKEIVMQGIKGKQITSVKSFPSYQEAEDYVANQKSGNYRVVGTNPFASPVPLEKLERYKLLYSSKNSKVQPYSSDIIPEVKIFEYIK
jgi:dolichyl-diphosphooligosaccharide--protein glycosyltransferase